MLTAAVLLAASTAYVFVPYYSHDPRLEIAANKLRPIITKLEDYKRTHGDYPASLDAIGIDDGGKRGSLPKIGYFAETGSNGKNEIDFAGSDRSQKIIGYEIYIDVLNGGLFYNHTDLHEGWFFNSGESEQTLDL
jgi:hypothetical protein